MRERETCSIFSVTTTMRKKCLQTIVIGHVTAEVLCSLGGGPELRFSCYEDFKFEHPFSSPPSSFYAQLFRLWYIFCMRYQTNAESNVSITPAEKYSSACPLWSRQAPFDRFQPLTTHMNIKEVVPREHPKYNVPFTSVNSYIRKPGTFYTQLFIVWYTYTEFH